MHLLHLEGGQLKLSEFYEPPHRYAILSHTWGPDEVVFKEIGEVGGKSKDKVGFRKIEFCMKQALNDGLQYCWIDTCCIDKTNSTELNEALNSMFEWYQKAEKCYVYLSDVPQKDFRSSRWFTRGWTLQELLAPNTVEFYDSAGRMIGTRMSRLNEIHDITHIPIAALQGQSLASFSIEERMSWVEKRETKRREDKVYCLLGIFDVSMSIIYGERQENAKSRLYKAIYDKSNPPIHPPIRGIELPRVIPKSVFHQTNDMRHQVPRTQPESFAIASQSHGIPRQHMDNAGHNGQRFKCRTCDKRYDTQDTTDQHMRDTGHGEPKIKCQTCPRRFYHQDAVKQHMVDKHRGSKRR